MSARVDGELVYQRVPQGVRVLRAFDPPPWRVLRWAGFLLRRVRVALSPMWPFVAVRWVRAERVEVVSGRPPRVRRVLAEIAGSRDPAISQGKIRP